MEFYPVLRLLRWKDLKIYTWEITSKAIWFSWCQIKEIKQSMIYKIHPVRDITEQQEATVWASAKAKTTYSKPQWIRWGIMGAGSRWNRWNARSTSKVCAVGGKFWEFPTLASSSFLATCVSLNGRIQSMANLAFPAFVQKLGIDFTKLMA